jgi:hypothetical protein
MSILYRTSRTTGIAGVPPASLGQDIPDQDLLELGEGDGALPGEQGHRVQPARRAPRQLEGVCPYHRRAAHHISHEQLLYGNIPLVSMASLE